MVRTIDMYFFKNNPSHCTFSKKPSDRPEKECLEIRIHSPIE